MKEFLKDWQWMIDYCFGVGIGLYMGWVFWGRRARLYKKLLHLD